MSERAPRRLSSQVFQPSGEGRTTIARRRAVRPRSLEPEDPVKVILLFEETVLRTYHSNRNISIADLAELVRERLGLEKINTRAITHILARADLISGKDTSPTRAKDRQARADEMLRNNPNTSPGEISDRLGVSLSTAAAYIRMSTRSQKY